MTITKFFWQREPTSQTFIIATDLHCPWVAREVEFPSVNGEER